MGSRRSRSRRSASLRYVLLPACVAISAACSDKAAPSGDVPSAIGAGVGGMSSAGSGGAAGTAGSTPSAGMGGSIAGAGGAASGSGGVAAAAGLASAGAAGSDATAGSAAAGAAGIAGAGGAGAAGAAGSSGTSGAAGSAPLGALTVSNLMIEPNPRMSLSCYVSWTTSEAASTSVEFGVDGYQFRVVDSTLATEHRVHVVGMHAETAYDIKAVSTSPTATGSAEGDFTTGKLPSNLPAQGTLVAGDPDKMQPGWTLTNYQVGGGTSTSTAPGIIVIVDEEGIPVWYFVHGDSADQFGMTSTDWLSNGHILIGNASAEPAQEVDLEANILWEGPTGGSPAASHHTGKLSTGNYLIVRESNASARVEELNPQNQVVWSWDLYDHIEPKTSAADWCHLNAVSVNEERNILYFNCRFQGLFAVNRANKELLWQMGAAIDDSTTGDITYLPTNAARFNDSHDPDVHADGTVLFYDNQGWSSHMGGEGNGSFHTRVVEYTLDETNKQATLSWEFPGSFAVDAWYTDEWMTPIWGEADRLQNGNVLVTAGVRGAGTNTRIFEVTREGEVVWGIEWPENNGSYRADRLSPPVERLP